LLIAGTTSKSMHAYPYLKITARKRALYSVFYLAFIIFTIFSTWFK